MYGTAQSGKKRIETVVQYGARCIIIGVQIWSMISFSLISMSS
ncbi:hypothetical protein PORCRE_774 [Porphyromonas crevioricanis JCM 15906]|uniref:Uncharacterized protein n=1 Tax=Porphyromonas crevioricanis JCM 15906 TaxID=1305617 RepID=T1CH03_9PORP|nr:hypothetical protein PORCRE_774 [Porphyromonas crevioricanis JCM 15906]GAD07585.1 hypothetical protein PORCAN_1207 [Porphyromonas crevioricanis JCM 13913]